MPNHFDVLILVVSFMLSGMYMLKWERRNKGGKSPNKKEYTTWESKPGLNGQLGELDNRRMRLAVVILLPKSPGLSGDRSNYGSSAARRSCRVQEHAVAIPYRCHRE